MEIINNFKKTVLGIALTATLLSVFLLKLWFGHTPTIDVPIEAGLSKKETQCEMCGLISFTMRVHFSYSKEKKDYDGSSIYDFMITARGCYNCHCKWGALKPLPRMVAYEKWLERTMFAHSFLTIFGRAVIVKRLNSKN